MIHTAVTVSVVLGGEGLRFEFVFGLEWIELDCFCCVICVGGLIPFDGLLDELVLSRDRFVAMISALLRALEQLESCLYECVSVLKPHCGLLCRVQCFCLALLRSIMPVLVFKHVQYLTCCCF